jgi:hypothetical protein
VRQRPAIGFMSALLIVGVAVAIVLRFAWKPMAGTVGGFSEYAFSL